MSCRYKYECPSYSEECEGPKLSFVNCLTFLINAYEKEKKRTRNERTCRVGNRYGRFQMWEQYSIPLKADCFIGGAPAGIFSRVYGIVEFDTGVERVEVQDILFCDEKKGEQ